MGYISIAFCAMAFTIYYTQARIVRDKECGLKAGVFSVVYHGRMAASHIKTITPKEMAENCIGECLDHDQCKSIDYNNSTKQCNLFDHTIGFSNRAFRKGEEGWIHYESDEENEVNVSNKIFCSSAHDTGPAIQF